MWFRFKWNHGPSFGFRVGRIRVGFRELRTVFFVGIVRKNWDGDIFGESPYRKVYELGKPH